MIESDQFIPRKDDTEMDLVRKAAGCILCNVMPYLKREGDQLAKLPEHAEAWLKVATTGIRLLEAITPKQTIVVHRHVGRDESDTFGSGESDSGAGAHPA